MQAIMETLFDIVYLTTVISLGVVMLRKSGGIRETRLFGMMAVILGCGDAFHLIPRSYALWTNGMDANAAALGFGKFVTSITMTIFYVILYHIWREHFKVKDGKGLTYTIYALAAARIALCFFPQNDWLSADAPVSWGIYRNLPFAAIGLIIIVLFYQRTRPIKTSSYRNMWLAITLSFGFYIPVVLFADAFPLVGTLMIPKTVAYVWIVWMGYTQMKKAVKA